MAESRRGTIPPGVVVVGNRVGCGLWGCYGWSVYECELEWESWGLSVYWLGS